MNMKRFKHAIALGLLTTLITPSAFAGDVVVTIDGVQAAKGNLYVSLQNQDEFLQNSGSYGAFIKAPTAGQQQVVIKGVSAGDYSISVWHDTNGDGIFTKAENGIPLDGWTMVNAATLRGVPLWDQVKFKVPISKVATALTMIYPK
jgi:uncharacterized protein (DUF2141 family)